MPECEKCIYTYIRGCPCGNHCCNAACLTVFKDFETWKSIFENVTEKLKVYDTAKPKMDELKFVKDLAEENKITEKEVLWVIREIRRYKKKRGDIYGRNR